MRGDNIYERFVCWAQKEPAICALTLIGSQAREGAEIGGADNYSDWDFQVVTTKPELFHSPEWAEGVVGTPLAYVFRGGRLGSALKATAMLPNGEFDAVIIPAGRLRLARWLIRFEGLRRIEFVARGLGDLSLTLRGGYRVLKGGAMWEAFFRRVVTDIPPRRLQDKELHILAEGFVCDYVSTHRKIDRGEFLAAQRWLHHQLAETNYRLLHELRQREGLVSFHDARRLESLADPRLIQVAVESILTAESLRNAAEKSAATCRKLMNSLVGAMWQWPDLSPLSLRTK